MARNRKRYVEIPTERLERELEAIGEACKSKGGAYVWGQKGRERVFTIMPYGDADDVRIDVYTTLGTGEDTVRECGADAIRIVVGLELEGPTSSRFHPYGASRRILRTAPNDVEDRVGTFLGRLRQALRDAYAQAKRVPVCPLCGVRMLRRKGKHGAFWGCPGYPSCKGTRRVVIDMAPAGA